MTVKGSSGQRYTKRQTSCEVEGCTSAVHARGLCNRHYIRVRHHGSVDSPSKTVEQRFMEKVDQEGPVPRRNPDLGRCWLWTGSTDKRGYGRLSVGGRAGAPELAHRVAYRLFRTEPPDDLHLDHLCCTPLCVNPDHLEPVDGNVNRRRARWAVSL